VTRALAPAIALVALLAACAKGPPPPAAVDTRNDACAWCRMAVSDLRFAAQIVAPAEEPKIFDDIGCLRSYLTGGARIPGGAFAYVADHRTKAWIPATRAVYAEVAGLSTPMASGLVAHSDEESRAADTDAVGGRPRDVRDVFGAASLPEGSP
jgi:copper chaperone NosL